MGELEYLIWFASVNLNPKKKKNLLDFFEDFSKIYIADEKELLKVSNINLKDIFEIQKSKNKELIKKYLEYINKNEIRVISINDKLYPKNLKNIYDPPVILFAKGNINLLFSIGISIVGSRMADQYGLLQSYNFAQELAKKKITIISGLAKGVDAFSHKGALNADGNTIAVIGSGIDIVYPKENYNLYNDIIKKGLVLSEYIVGTRPAPQNFPMRNRIVSGLSNGVLVVQAGIKSGAMITVDFALDQGKNVYVIPGNINNKLSAGCNFLIKEGAKVVTEPKDILEDICAANLF